MTMLLKREKREMKRGSQGAYLVRQVSRVRTRQKASSKRPRNKKPFGETTIASAERRGIKRVRMPRARAPRENRTEKQSR